MSGNASVAAATAGLKRGNGTTGGSKRRSAGGWGCGLSSIVLGLGLCVSSYRDPRRYSFTGLNDTDFDIDAVTKKKRIQQRPDQWVKFGSLLGKGVPTDPLDAILEGHLSLIDIHIPRLGLVSQGEQLYADVKATFCHLSWELQEQNPTKVPKFKDLQQDSDLCRGTLYTVQDLWSLARRATDYDHRNHTFVATTTHPDEPKSAPPSLVVFHQSRCGSTLVANLLAAAFSNSSDAISALEGAIQSTPPVEPAARVYSESPPPATALKACEFARRCDPGAQSALIRDVFYIMGRSPAEPKTSKHFRFYKIQSIGAHSIHTFREAMPNTPWMFVYRDSVEIIMSHFKDYLQDEMMPNYKNKNLKPVCLRKYGNKQQAQVLLDIVGQVHHGTPVDKLNKHDYCAAHLASLAESALREYLQQKQQTASDGGQQQRQQPPTWFVNYEQLPDYIWDRVLPKVLGTEFQLLPPTSLKNMQETAHVYSKVRGPKAGMEWKEDSTAKRNQAPNAVKQAAKQYMDPAFAKMEAIRNAQDVN